MTFFAVAVTLALLSAVTAAASPIVVAEGWTACRNDPSTGRPSMDACVNAEVPGTILTSLLRNSSFAPITLENVYTDENLSLLPDIHTTGPEYYTFWWRNSLILPPRPEGGGRLMLTAKGVSYRARLEVAGEHVLPIGDKDAAGMFRTWTYDLTSFAAAAEKRTTIAFLVSPPDYPGDASNGGQGGDHLIAKNGPVAQFSAGWDWAQATPDRMTGLWDQVTLHWTKKVEVSEPMFVVTFPDDSWPSRTHAAAELSVTANVRVPAMATVSGDVMVSASVVDASGTVVGTTTAAVTAVAAAGHNEEEHKVAFPPMQLPRVQLWWPASHGTPHMYQIQFTFQQQQQQQQQQEEEEQQEGAAVLSVPYGFRQASFYIHAATKGWALRLNGIDIFLQGGNYIQTDQLLQYVGNRRRYEAEIRMYVEMGLNLIRVWGGSIAERDYFYEACDRQGLLVMQEFWMTGDNNGRWGGDYDYPADNDVYLDNAKSTILRLRSHCSLVMWCFGNELNPAGVNPKPAIHDGLSSLLDTLDPQRFFIASSMSTQKTDPAGFDPSYALSPQDGPYSPLDEETFFVETNPGLPGYQKTPLSFQPEVGSVGTPEYASLKRFLSAEHVAAFPDRRSKTVDPAWVYHKYEAYNSFDEEKDYVYDGWGDNGPTNTKEWCQRANLVQFSQYRALFEGFSAYMFTSTAAVLMWKASSPWPALRGALYDYYLRQSGGFWGVRAALRDTVHVQQTPAGIVQVVNKAPAAQLGLRVQASQYSLTGEPLGRVNTTVSVGANMATSVASSSSSAEAEAEAAAKDVFFTKLQLFGSNNAILSENVYWKDDHKHELSKLPAVSEGQFKASCVFDNGSGSESGRMTLTLSNSAVSVAIFMLNIELAAAASASEGDDRLLPVFYSDNYITMFPGEETVVHMDTQLTAQQLQAMAPGVRLSAWNMETITVEIL